MFDGDPDEHERRTMRSKEEVLRCARQLELAGIDLAVAPMPLAIDTPHPPEAGADIGGARRQGDNHAHGGSGSRPKRAHASGERTRALTLSVRVVGGVERARNGGEALAEPRYFPLPIPRFLRDPHPQRRPMASATGRLNNSGDPPHRAKSVQVFKSCWRSLCARLSRPI